MVAKTLLYSLAFMVLALSVAPSVAREWKPQPHAAAREYGMIKHERSLTDQVLIYWMPDLSIPKSPEAEAARALLADYILIGTVRVQIDAQARMTVKAEAPPFVTLLNGEAVKQFETSELSPALTGLVTILSRSIGQGLGLVGQGIKWYVYDGVKIDSCETGGFIVNFAGVNYDYQTPIPGCGDPT